MYKHDKCNKKVADESLKFIEMYRNKKENSIYDDFYHSHLDCFEELIEDWKKQEEDCYAVIMCRKGHKHDNGSYSPVYATVCKKPHWNDEGIMLTSGLYDATKFDLFDEDLHLLLKFISNQFKDRVFEVAPINKGVFGDEVREVWSLDEIKGDFDRTGKVSDKFVKEVID